MFCIKFILMGNFLTQHPGFFPYQLIDESNFLCYPDLV